MYDLSANVMTFEASSTFAVGVNVAVHVNPPSLELTGVVSAPPSTVRSAFVNAVTFSLNVTVNVAVSPIFSADLSSPIDVTVGDNLVEKLQAAILVRDGVIEAIEGA